jgi:hypothetical protein
MVCQPYILQNKLDYFSNSDVVNVCLFVCQYAVNNLLIPGQIENWIMFFNLKGTSILSLPEPIKLLVKELSDNFSFRLYKCYVLGMSFIMRILYKFVCTFIGQPDEDKIVILDGRKDKHLFDDFNPDNLEKRFGGNAQDLIYENGDCLFPPRVPTDNVFFPWEDKNKILISENEYIEKCKNGDIPIESMSPFVQEILINEERKRKIEEKEKKNKIKNEQERNNNYENRNIPNQIPIKKSSENNNKNRIIYENNKIIYDINAINKRKKKAKEIKEFLTSDDWKIESEFINNKIFKINRTNNFINDLHKLIDKREKFKLGITKLKQ